MDSNSITLSAPLTNDAPSRVTRHHRSATRSIKTPGAVIKNSDIASPADMIETRDGVKKTMIASTIAVLRFLARNNDRVGVNAIARELSLAPSTCFKILRALNAEGCVDFDKDTKCYSIGVGAIMLARSALDPACAFTNVQSYLERKADEAGVAIGMWRILAGERIALIGFVEGPGDLRLHMRIGQRLPMYLGALGRAVAASRGHSAEELHTHFDRLRWERPPAFQQYCDQVIEARVRGYAADEGHYLPGVTTIASVIHDRRNCARYGLSAVTLARPSAPVQVERIGGIVKQAAGWVEQRLFASFAG